jgi:hypothetical protein
MSNLNQPFIFPGKHPNVLSAMQKTAGKTNPLVAKKYVIDYAPFNHV